MTDDEYEKLEQLLSKLKSEIGVYCIVPEHINDGYTIATYDQKGYMSKTEISHDLKSCVAKIKKP